MKKKSLLIELQFLPPVEYFVLLDQYDDIIIDAHEHFTKQTYRNRAHILGANKVIDLVVPVKRGSQRVPVSEVKIDYQHVWLQPLWKSISSAYGKSPFFEFYSDEFERIFFSEPADLYRLNFSLLSFCLNCLQVDRVVKESESFILESNEHVDVMRGIVNPKKPSETRKFYHPYPYQQIFGNKFVPNLSILDLLFCEGPNSYQIIKNSSAI